MAGPGADDFVRKGRPLSEWIDDLIGVDRAKRERAALMVQAMHMGVRDPHVDITPEMLPQDATAHQAAFDAAVRAVFAAYDVAARNERIARLMDFIEESRNQSIAQMKADDAWLKEALESGPDAGSGKAMADVLENMSGRLERSIEHAPIWVALVFRALDTTLQDHAARVASWLDQRGLAQDAHEAIRRMRSAARPLVPRLLAELDAQANAAEAWWWNGIATLAAALDGESEAIGQVSKRLSGPPAVAGNAAAVLGAVGPAVVTVVPDVVERMLALSRHETEFVRLAALGAMASLGAGHKEVAARLIEAVRDGRHYETGYAIEAFGPATVPAGEAIPLLLAQFEAFEEFDPDREHQGSHARIAEALARYGAAAVPALPLLVRHLASDGDLNESVVVCLGAIGPAAAEVLPALQEAARSRGLEDLAADQSYVGVAWRAIAGARAD